jgi:hypothetical protein
MDALVDQQIFGPAQAIISIRCNGRRRVSCCWCGLARFGRPSRWWADPGYSDPSAISPDNNRSVTMDVRDQNRFWFIAGLPGVPGPSTRISRLHPTRLQDRVPHGEEGHQRTRRLHRLTAQCLPGDLHSDRHNDDDRRRQGVQAASVI